MSGAYARDLDLNLLRLLVVVAEAGSITAAAARLYLTQPAVSLALRRLADAIGEPLLARHGRGVVLTERGARLVDEVRPHLEAMVHAAVSPPAFDPLTSDRTIRLGLADAADEWLLPPLLQLLARRAPRMRIVCVPVQFRTIGDALATRRVDMAVTVADELPRSIVRRPIFRGGFVCMFDPRHVRLGRRPTLRAYLAHEHVVVSYNGDLRGVVEDTYGVERRVRCSVPGFSSVGAILEGSDLVATLPEIVAHRILERRPSLCIASFPLPHEPGGMDLLWPSAVDSDDASRFVRDAIVRIMDGILAADARRKAKLDPPRRSGASPSGRRSGRRGRERVEGRAGDSNARQQR